MKAVTIIPARLDSTRLPQKVFRPICGMPMIEHVYRRCELSAESSTTYVATPDEEIRNAVNAFGGSTIMTGEHFQAQERVAEAAKSVDADIIVNVHGDEPLVHPEMVNNAIKRLQKLDDNFACSLVCTTIKNESDFKDLNQIKIVTGNNNQSLYHSRQPIPTTWNKPFDDISVYKSLGVAAYYKEKLIEIANQERGQLEEAEEIFYLRVLENGYQTSLVESAEPTHSVHVLEDLERASDLMAEDEIFCTTYGKSQDK